MFLQVLESVRADIPTGATGNQGDDRKIGALTEVIINKEKTIVTGTDSRVVHGLYWFVRQGVILIAIYSRCGRYQCCLHLCLKIKVMVFYGRLRRSPGDDLRQLFENTIRERIG